MQEEPEKDSTSEELAKAVQVANAPVPVALSKKAKFKRFLKTKKGIVVTVVAGLLVVIGILAAIPVTRYGIAGLVVKKNPSITVIDSVTKKPVSGVDVKLGNTLVHTNSSGLASFSNIPVGQYNVTIAKKYYKSNSGSYTVPVLSNPAKTSFTVVATGRTVTFTVVNKVTNELLESAKVSFDGTTTETDAKGIASVVLAPSTIAQAGTVTKDGFNDTNISLIVKNEDGQDNQVGLIPAGKIYFLSKRTGKINVMSSNLDGTNQAVVVEGTGQEDDSSTVILSSTDWKYLALQASRDSDKPKLYLLNAANGKLSVIDEGDADFQLIGWSGHQFVYLVNRHTTNSWDNKRQALKSYNAETNKLTTLDETQGAGTSYYDYAYENMTSPYIVSGTIVYTKAWSVSQYAATNNGDKKSAIMSVNPNGQSKSRVKEFAITVGIDSRIYEPQGVYFRTYEGNNASSYFEFEDGKVVSVTSTNDAKFYNSFYPTYLLSPSGNKTLWYEPRDGKNAIFVGDAKGQNAKEISSNSEYIPFGWYSDDYVLFSKNSSELYIASSKNTLSTQLLKVSDYHKAQLNYPGYGSGYGGQ